MGIHQVVGLAQNVIKPDHRIWECLDGCHLSPFEDLQSLISGGSGLAIDFDTLTVNIHQPNFRNASFRIKWKFYIAIEFDRRI